VREHQAEIGIEMVDFKQMVYVQEKAQYFPVDEVPEGSTVLDISGTELAAACAKGWRSPTGSPSPRWSAAPQDLARALQAGLHGVLHGLLGLGQVDHRQRAHGQADGDGRPPVTLLDGDVVRKHLSSELGFSKEHRDINIKRIGYVASEITKNGGIAICAPIAPYAATRREVREMIEAFGAFIEVHVATSLEECERRDRKGSTSSPARARSRSSPASRTPTTCPRHPSCASDTEGSTWTPARIR
jgi:sulfate adenylyltransferase